MDLIISGGYPYHYRSVSDELEASKADNWYPATVDFRATALHSGGAAEASTFDQLIDIIGKKPKHSIRELGIVGHANEEAFVLGGRIDRGAIMSPPTAVINKASILDNLGRIQFVRDRFATQDITPPSITLFACDAGASDGLLEELSKAFEVTVQGFKREIWWCFAPSKGRVVRGRTWYDSVGAGIHPRCDGTQFSADIRSWKPENASYAGNQIDI